MSTYFAPNPELPAHPALAGIGALGRPTPTPPLPPYTGQRLYGLPPQLPPAISEMPNTLPYLHPQVPITNGQPPIAPHEAVLPDEVNPNGPTWMPTAAASPVSVMPIPVGNAPTDMPVPGVIPGGPAQIVPATGRTDQQPMIDPAQLAALARAHAGVAAPPASAVSKSGQAITSHDLAAMAAIMGAHARRLAAMGG